MPKPLRAFLFSLLFLCSSAHFAAARHIYAGDFYYTYISGNTYQVTLVLFSDCAETTLTSNLYNGIPQISVTKGGVSYPGLSLTLSNVPDEVTPVCPAQQSNTSCNGGSIPGIRRFIYTGQVTLDGPSTNWLFRYSGQITNAQSGRSQSLTNIFSGSGNGNTQLTMEAMLNNTGGPNSSPTFTTIPTPFYCLNIAQQYNQGSVDPNGDSLSFALVPALTQNGTVNYQSPYSATQPLAASAFSYNTLNGQMAFTPSLVQQSLVVNRVSEYKDGVLVGTAMREMTFIVLGSCSTTPPTGYIDTTNANSLVNLSSGGTNTVMTCEGAQTVQFSVAPHDANNDQITVTLSGVPAGATATVTNNNTTQPTILFSWNMAGVAPGTYTFFATYKDNGCPLTGQQTQAYTIQVVQPASLFTEVLEPTRCIHQAFVRYNLSGGVTPRTIQILQGNTIIRSYTSASNTLTDSLPPGNYTVNIGGVNALCPSSFPLTIIDSGKFQSPLVDSVFYCRGASATPIAATAYPGAVLTWYNAAQVALPSAPVPNTNVTGITTVYVRQTYGACVSDIVPVPVFVTERPVASAIVPSPVCARDTITISFNGAVGVGPILQYTWNWQGGIVVSNPLGGPWKVRWDDSGTKVLTLQVSENKCPSFPITKSIRVKPTPAAQFNVANICMADTLLVSYASQKFNGAAYSWDFGEGVAVTATHDGSGPYSVHWSTPGTKSISLATSLEGCAESRTRTIIVYPQPGAAIQNPEIALCYGDKIYLKAEGDGIQTWTPSDRISTDPGGAIFTRVLQPSAYHVEVKNQYGCTDKDSIAYRVIEPCCNFAFPNAFSPNSDGKNDRYGVVTYGNTAYFQLRIYNRWGDCVFFASSQDQTWDGTFNGRPCENGVYFYTLKAHCMTGPYREEKGDITLLR